MSSLTNSPVRDLLAGLQEGKFTSVDLVQVCPLFERRLYD